MPLQKAPFQRTQFTWFVYIAIAFFAYTEAMLGPLMPALRAELGFNYTVAGLHFSAFALGVVLAGFTADSVAARWGRSAAWWGGGIGMVGGIILLAVGETPALTIAGSGVMGIFGGTIFIIAQAALSDHQWQYRTIALTEANIAASVVVTIEPLFIGGFEQAGFGWRATLWLVAALFLAAGYFTRRIPIPTETTSAPDSHTLENAKLPPAFWLYWLVLFFGVAAEWCVAFWGAEFLRIHAGLPQTTAITLMSLFFAAAVLARFSTSRLAHRFNGQTLLLVAAGLAFAGFLPFWLGTSPAVTIVGLFMLGFGIANFYPLALSQALHTAPRLANQASARITIGTGGAVLLMPLALGNIADRVGIWLAFGLVGGLLIAILAITGSANSTLRRHSA